MSSLHKNLLLLAAMLIPLLASSRNIQRKQLIDNGWTFNDHETVNLPHDWSALLPIDRNAPAGNDGGYYPTGIGIYKKTLNLGNEYTDRKLWLYFEGVYQDSEVKVNGTRSVCDIGVRRCVFRRSNRIRSCAACLSIRVSVFCDSTIM